jgi:CheY-like chemotaxis protein/two-component sensor histidine kinase
VAERTPELTQSREQLRALATELNLTEQRERRRLATELHDYLAQLLALGRIRLAQAKQQPMTPVLGKNLNEVQEVLDQALTYARTLVAQLSPPMLKDFGLPMALKWLAEQMQQRDLAVSLELEKDLPPLPEDHAMLLFQSVRELLLNVMKHAETKQARITVREIEGRLHISVADPGKGFELTDSASAAEGDRSPGFGLFSIRERMLSLGGRFELSSRPGMGTEATLIAPLAPHEMTAELEVPSSESAVSDLEKNSALPTQNSELHQSSSPNNSALTNQNSELPEGAMVRVVIADDHAMVRQGLGGLLAGYAGIEVIGEAANGEEAVELAVRLKPDIVLMDVNMPKMDGVEATRRISGSHSSVTIIGLSVDNSRHIEQAMREAGAAAFHTKEAAVDQLYRTIQNVLHKGA